MTARHPEGRDAHVRSPESLVERRENAGSSADGLTLYDRSVALPIHVRELLDWLIDEELKRWQREEQ